VLWDTGRAVGDNAVPDVSSQWHSIAHWLMLGTAFLGVVLLTWGIVRFSPQHYFLDSLRLCSSRGTFGTFVGMCEPDHPEGVIHSGRWPLYGAARPTGKAVPCVYP